MAMPVSGRDSDASEGFSRVDVVPFARQQDSAFVNRAVIASCDDVGDLARLAPRLRELRDDGYRLLGISWQPAIGEGTESETTVRATFANACRRLDAAFFSWVPRRI